MTGGNLPFATEPIEFGQSTTSEARPPGTSKLVVASYNIRYARGPFLISGGLLRKLGLLRRSGRQNIVDQNIRRAADAFSSGKLLPAIDLLALQEADKRTERSGGVHVARELGAQMKMWWAHAAAGIPRGIKPVDRQWWLDFEEPIQLFDEGDTGVSLISRYPLEDVTRIDLPWHECLWRPRLAIAGTIRFANARLRILNVHVDPHAAIDGQLAQLEVIVEHANRTDGPTVILGDFNTLSKRKCIDTRTYMETKGFVTPFVTGTATWRGSGLRLHADWIFTRGVTVSRFGVAKPLSVSDHWPIWAEIQV